MATHGTAGWMVVAAIAALILAGEPIKARSQTWSTSSIVIDLHYKTAIDVQSANGPDIHYLEHHVVTTLFGEKSVKEEWENISYLKSTNQPKASKTTTSEQMAGEDRHFQKLFGPVTSTLSWKIISPQELQRTYITRTLISTMTFSLDKSGHCKFDMKFDWNAGATQSKVKLTYNGTQIDAVEGLPKVVFGSCEVKS